MRRRRTLQEEGGNLRHRSNCVSILTNACRLRSWRPVRAGAHVLLAPPLQRQLIVGGDAESGEEEVDGLLPLILWPP